MACPGSQQGQQERKPQKLMDVLTMRWPRALSVYPRCQDSVHRTAAAFCLYLKPISFQNKEAGVEWHSEKFIIDLWVILLPGLLLLPSDPFTSVLNVPAYDQSLFSFDLNNTELNSLWNVMHIILTRDCPLKIICYKVLGIKKRVLTKYLQRGFQSPGPHRSVLQQRACCPFK